MLVFISDLHLDDDSAGTQTVPVGAFTGAFRDIAQLARDAGSTDVELILLGDVFDLVRTTAWSEFPVEERPWGVLDSLDSEERARRLVSVEQNANTLLDRLVEANKETFDFLAGDLSGFEHQPKRHYIPGNHDRICNQFASLRRRVTELLRLGDRPDPDAPFAYAYKNPEYGVFARHGHEWDAWNIELDRPLPLSDPTPPPLDVYLRIPIGELIAAELASQLAPAVYTELKKVPGLAASESRRLSDQFKSVDDVRPLPALIPWLFSHLKALSTTEGLEENTQHAIKTGINHVLAGFQGLAFTHEWMHKHHSLNPFAPANLLADIVRLGQALDIDVVDALAPLVAKLTQGGQSTNHISDASDDFQRLDCEDRDRYLYVLYGHTHQPEQAPVALTAGGARPRLYVNTGTWRPSHRQTYDGKGFVTTKGITYSVFYHPAIDPKSQAAIGADKYPLVEAWTGMLLEHPTVEEEIDRVDPAADEPSHGDARELVSRRDLPAGQSPLD